MLPKSHIISGFVFSILIYFIFSITVLQAFLIFFASVFIDFDHYLWFVIKKKDFSLKKAYKWFKEKKKKYLSLNLKERQEYKKTFLIFHGIEALLIVFLLAYLNKLFLYVLIGMVFHLVLDYIEFISIKEPLYSKISQTAVLIKNKGKKDVDF